MVLGTEPKLCLLNHTPVLHLLPGGKEPPHRSVSRENGMSPLDAERTGEPPAPALQVGGAQKA